MAVVVIAQARMASTRLPGKVLMPLAGDPALHHVLRQLSAMSEIDLICVATSDLPQDDVLAEAAASLGAIVVRGSEEDVLGRYVRAATITDAQTVLRVTCDCPLIDPALCDQLVRLYRQTACDYASISVRTGWPQGLDCEIFSQKLLTQAASLATEPYEREHVTPWIYRSPDHNVLSLPGPSASLSEQRWVLDTPEDYAFLSTLFEYLPKTQTPFAWKQVRDVIDANCLQPPKNAV